MSRPVNAIKSDDPIQVNAKKYNERSESTFVVNLFFL